MEDNKSILNFKSTTDTNSSDNSNEPVSVSSSEKLTKQSGLRGWYAIHTNTGYEDQVADNLRQRVESFDMKDKIFNVIVPKEKEIEIKNSKRRTVEKKIFPGYVLVEMVVTDESWYVVRNTPSVTGFIGMGIQPTPMSPQEMDRIMKRMGVEEPKYNIELKEDDLVRIKDGPLKGFEGKITEVDSDKGRIKVLVSMFGRETPVTLDFLQVSKV
jgi:transcriptional antiterminator NusG